MFRNYVQKLVEELSLEGGSLPHDMQTFSITIGDVATTLIDRSPGVEYSAILGELNEETAEQEMTDMLRGNFLGQATRKAYLGLDESGKRVVVSMFIPIVRSFREFKDMLEDFANVVGFWKDKLKLV